MIYTIHGCTIDVASGGQSAKGSRLEVRSADGKTVLISAAEAEFETKVENRDGVDVSICAQEQVTLWARALPDVIEAEKVEEPTETDET